MAGFLQALQPLLPVLGLILAIAGVCLMVLYAPDDARQAMATEYSSFLKVFAATVGPAAAAFLGDLASPADRPKFDANSPPGLKRKFIISRWASCLVFGMIGGAGVQAVGLSAWLGYAAAATGGLLGTKIINVIFNRILDKYAPPVTPGGGAA